MEKEIVNRVAKSKLITVDLETYYPKGDRFEIDLSQWLDAGLILREAHFREALEQHQWEVYKDGYVAIHCSTEAIVPVWAYMLTGKYLEGIARDTVVGTPEVLETVLFREALNSLDVESLKDRPVIIKGCSNLPVPASAYVWAIQKIQKVAKSVLFGEACSSVPLFRKR